MTYPSEVSPKGVHLEPVVPVLMSVVICTHNRAEYLRRALKAICRQSLPPNRYEVVVIDNNSSDSTAALVQEIMGVNRNVRYAFEARAGVSHARNRGVQEAGGRYIGFTDDDAIADRHWLSNALRCFQEVSPTPRVVGGPIYPLFPEGRPSWFSPARVAHTWGEGVRFLREGEHFYGGNMFFDRDLLRNVVSFNPEFGVAADKLRYGDDVEIFDQLWRRLGDQTRAFYSPTVYVHHMWPRSRTTASYVLKRAFAGGQTFGLASSRQGPRARIIALARSSFHLAYGCRRAVLSLPKKEGWKEWAIHSSADVLRELGRTLGVLGINVAVGRS